jgi:hypothetical protein
MQKSMEIDSGHKTSADKGIQRPPEEILTLIDVDQRYL